MAAAYNIAAAMLMKKTFESVSPTGIYCDIDTMIDAILTYPDGFFSLDCHDYEVSLFSINTPNSISPINIIIVIYIALSLGGELLSLLDRASTSKITATIAANFDANTFRNLPDDKKIDLIEKIFTHTRGAGPDVELREVISKTIKQQR